MADQTTVFKGSAALRPGLRLLHAAWRRARALELDLWQCAVTIDALHSVGLTNNDLRELLVQGLVEHANEVTTTTDSVRRFQKVDSLMLSKTACFVLTEEGGRIASRDGNARWR